MAEQWLSYSELGERLGVSAEAARQKAIRSRWRRQTANDGRTQVLVDIEELRVATTPRKPKEVSDDRPTPNATPDQHPADDRTFDALEAHIATLREMVAKAEGIAERESVQAEQERTRADGERERADAERGRADDFMRRLDEMFAERLKAAETQREVLRLETELSELRAAVEAARRRSWWRRLRA